MPLKGFYFVVSHDKRSGVDRSVVQRFYGCRENQSTGGQLGLLVSWDFERVMDDPGLSANHVLGYDVDLETSGRQHERFLIDGSLSLADLELLLGIPCRLHDVVELTGAPTCQGLD